MIIDIDIGIGIEFKFEQQSGHRHTTCERIGSGTSAFYKCPPSIEITKILPKTVSLV